MYWKKTADVLAGVLQNRLSVVSAENKPVTAGNTSAFAGPGYPQPPLKGDLWHMACRNIFQRRQNFEPLECNLQRFRQQKSRVSESVPIGGVGVLETYQQKTNFENFSSFENKTLNKIVLNKTATGAEWVTALISNSDVPFKSLTNLSWSCL